MKFSILRYLPVFPEADKAEQVFIGNDHTEDFPGKWSH